MITNNKEKYNENPLVAILLCTYNGERYLKEQIESLERQTYQNWVLFVSDDNSCDKTTEILNRYKKKWKQGKLIIKKGPQKGFSKNFLSLACNPRIIADYYAFCDQDDVWLSNKLDAALNIIKSFKNKKPILYCGRSIYVNETGNEIGVSRNMIRPKIFQNALVQCVSGGNTMIFNHQLKKKLEGRFEIDVPSHDWWLYIMATGCDGIVIFDNKSYIKYRQHPHSLVGRNTTLKSMLQRFMKIINGEFSEMISKNINAIESIKNILTEDNKEILRNFKQIRSEKLIDRIKGFISSRIYRQTRHETFLLFVATIFKKL